MAIPTVTVDELVPFILRDVEGLESPEKKGAGAYGAVYDATVRGVPCIAKRLHDILVNEEVSRRERTSLQERFRQECVTLSMLKHPNIVHFVGVHYGRAPGDLSLIMEKLHTDLGKCLDTKPNIPLPLKLSILLDVSYGLLYLHTLTPPIIHRDLTARNILLTCDMRAKIADLGVSKILDLHAQVARAQTKAPGTQYYMPPDARSDNPHYGVELDVFSFGHLALYTITQAPPEPDDSKITPTAVERGEVQIAKREASINIMGRDHCLCPLIMQCLQDKPERRPSTSDLNQAVKELSVDLTHEKDENRKLLDDLQEANKDRGYLREALAAVTASREELVTRVQLLEAQIDHLGSKEESAQQQLKSLRDNYQTMQEKYLEMKAENQKKIDDLETRQKAHLETIMEINNRCASAVIEKANSLEESQEREKEVKALQADLVYYEEALKAAKQKSESLEKALQDLQDDAIHKQGFLTKKGRRFGNWTKRLFVLDSGGLAYYNTDKPVQKIHLSEVKKVQITHGRTLFPHTFEVHAREQIFDLAADSKEEMDSWITMLKVRMHQPIPPSLWVLPRSKSDTYIIMRQQRHEKGKVAPGLVDYNREYSNPPTPLPQVIHEMNTPQPPPETEDRASLQATGIHIPPPPSRAQLQDNLPPIQETHDQSQ